MIPTLRRLFLLLCIAAFNHAQVHAQALYKDASAPIDARVEDLLSRMTLEEKFWQLYMIPGDLSDGKTRYKHGIFGFQVATKGKSESGAEQMLDYSAGGKALQTAQTINEMQAYFTKETRLGIPILPFDEALHGLIREDATAFPQAIGLAASWNTALMGDVAAAIADEVKARGIRQNLSPVINIARDVRWGRTEETYGEDPFLTSRMGVAYVAAFEKIGVVTTPKHFVANVGDGGRDSYPIHHSKRLLEEIYFPAFKACIEEAKAWSIMTAYNSVEGRPATASKWLLHEKLKSDWNFDGFVITDASATGGANVLHFTSKDYAESTKQVIENGLDVIFQTSYEHYPLFYEAFEKGMISTEAIDQAVRRVLYAKFKLGLFENPYVDLQALKARNRVQENKPLARKAARESIVLLKNENHTLPLSKDLSSIAVIGPDAAEARLGGYSGPGNSPVSVLDGIKTKLGSRVDVQYALGSYRTHEAFRTVAESQLFHEADGQLVPGLKARYWNNITLAGTPNLSRIDSKIDFSWTLFSPDQEKINYDFYSAKWEGKLVSPATGTYNIGLSGDDGYRLYINGALVVDNWKKQTVREVVSPFYFEQDKAYDIQVEFFETAGNVRLKLIWDIGVENDWQLKIEEAVQLSLKQDVTVLCLGIEEGEFRDRAYLGLLGHQEELIHRLASTGKPMVVVLVGGSAITMNSWIEDVSAIVDVWYPGDEGGHAVADVLFGDYNPAGRLPITFPIHEAQLPLYYNHKPTGRGDDYVNLSGKPLFPFGYGLSYTTFEYSNLRLNKASILPTEPITISCTVTNTGNVAGDEVVQLYIKDLFASVARPILELKGFERIHLEKGESKEVTFTIGQDELSMLNEAMERVVEPGEFRVLIGGASNDIRLRGHFEVRY